jgi:hypothetical protein
MNPQWLEPPPLSARQYAWRSGFCMKPQSGCWALASDIESKTIRSKDLLKVINI